MLLFRLVLAISLWQGPILWGHAHTADISENHLTRFHIQPTLGGMMQWHWHLSPPARLPHCPFQDEDQPQNPNAEFCGGTFSPLPALDLASTVAVDGHGVLIVPVCASTAKAGPRGFLSTYLPSGSLQKIHSKYLC
jgi:hypothetical protein